MGYGCLADAMNTLEGAVSRGPYIAGDNFTAADVYVGSQIGFGLNSARSRSGPRSNATGPASMRDRPPRARNSSMMR